MRLAADTGGTFTDCLAVDPGGRLWVGPDDPAHEADFNAWYDDVHLAEFSALPGVISARRFKVEGNGPAAYAAASAPPTAPSPTPAAPSPSAHAGPGSPSGSCATAANSTSSTATP